MMTKALFPHKAIRDTENSENVNNSTPTVNVTVMLAFLLPKIEDDCN